MQAPTSGRVPQDNGTTKTLKMSVGRQKLDENPDFARMLYQYTVLNGAQYCRPHLLIRCHLCATDSWMLKQEADEERRRLALTRPSGDEALNERARKWGDRTQESLLLIKLKTDQLRQKYGDAHAETHPQHWQNQVRWMIANERTINDEFLQDAPEGSQCCYWACKQPNADNLLRCTGCKIAKYCCEDHQKKDWKWEHRGECRAPPFIVAEYADDRKRNLAGDYRSRDDMQEEGALG